MPIREHDVATLKRPVGRWPAGTRGTVVSDHGPHKDIEVSDDNGWMLDLLLVPEADLELAWRFPAEKFRGEQAKRNGVLVRATGGGRIRELDMVALKIAVGDLRAGAEGTVVEDRGGKGKGKMVEFCNSDERPICRLLVAEDQLRLIWKYDLQASVELMKDYVF